MNNDSPSDDSQSRLNRRVIFRSLVWLLIGLLVAMVFAIILTWLTPPHGVFQNTISSL
jgi:hypothetical protein